MILSPYPLKYRPLYYRRYFDDIFVLFKPSDHIKRFQSYLNPEPEQNSETEQNEEISFLYVNVLFVNRANLQQVSIGTNF